jgi:hypothetical protein
VLRALSGDGSGVVFTVAQFELDGVWYQPSGYIGSAPTVADFDGDGEPEIGVAGMQTYRVYDADGSTLWQTPITDVSSSSTGSSVFDLEGDGKAEVVFADEVAFYIFDGASGATLYREDRHTHGTALEYPVVVDVDNDGQAEIVLGSANYRNISGMWDGITVLGNRDGSWARAGTIWNQRAFSITNVEADASLPAVTTPSWLDTDTFRAGNQQLAGGVATPDLELGLTDRCTETCPDGSVLLAFSMGNSGLYGSWAYAVELRSHDSSGESTAIREELSTLAAGESLVLGPYELSEAEWGGELRIHLDVDEQVDERDEVDNVMSLGSWPCDS